MKKLLLFGAAISALWACEANVEETNETTDVNTEEVVEVAEVLNYYGEIITADDAISATELRAALEGKDSIIVKVEGIVTEACQKKGCWMIVDLGNDENMRVRFKDYGFFVPKNLDGQKTVMEGVARIETIPVSMLQHLAFDANKTQEEIDLITEDEVTLTFEANGVIVYGEVAEEEIMEAPETEVEIEEVSTEE